MIDYITEEEAQNIAILTKGKGRGKWFLGEVKIAYGTMKTLRENRRADSSVVEKLRDFLKTPVAQQFIELAKKAEEKSAA